MIISKKEGKQSARTELIQTNHKNVRHFIYLTMMIKEKRLIKFWETHKYIEP